MDENALLLGGRYFSVLPGGFFVLSCVNVLCLLDCLGFYVGPTLCHLRKIDLSAVCLGPMMDL